MADEHKHQQQPNFHWPPTAEELDTIQVVDMQGRPLPLPGTRRRWRAGLAKATMTQAGILAASLAAIGIALTSMLAAPAQPVTKEPKPAVAVAAPAPLSAQGVAPTAPTPTFVPQVTLDLEKPSPADIRPPQTSTTPAARVQFAAAQPRPTPVARTAERRLATYEPRRDPVSKFAVQTGKSLWKAMRAVGRSFKRQGDGEFFATRSAGGRRTAGAVGLQAENAPSNR